MGQYSIGSGALLDNPIKRVYHEFRHNPLTGKLAGGAPTGTAGDTNILFSPGELHLPGLGLEYHIKGTQDILAPVLTAVGLNIGLDQTNNDGVEFTPGILARSGLAFVVGTDKAFFLAVRAKIADASGADPFLVGFRKAEAYQADFNDYADLAGIGVVGTSDPGKVQTETILTGAATVETDTTNTWADAAVKTLRVNVSAAGVVTYQVEGAAPTTVAAYSFTNGLTVVPCIIFLNGSDVAGLVELISFDCGLQ